MASVLVTPPVQGSIDPTDMLPIGAVTWLDTPDQDGSPIWIPTATLTTFSFLSDGIFVDFTTKNGPGRWADYTAPGSNGPVEYTVCLMMQVSGLWYGAGILPYWNALERNGGAPSGLWRNWLFSQPSWSPLSSRVPVVGETIGFVVMAGLTRHETTVTTVAERTQTILIPLPDDNGGIWTTP